MTRRSASGSGPFVGPRQPTESRMAESAVWVRATRPGPGSYEPRVAEKTVKPVSPKWSMQGTGHAPNLNPSYCAGDYDLTRVGSIGGDSTVSKHRSPPKSTFGTSRRDDSSAMYSVFTVKPK